MNSRRVLVGASIGRFRQTSTMDEASAFAPKPTGRFESSVLTGHVP